jgi:AcrR family transcriptional regulator
MINAVSDLDPRRREELHRVAREVFADRGFETTTLRDIGGRMGLTAGSLYHYIDSKQALLASVMRDLEPPVLRPWSAAVGDAGAATEWLVEVMRTHVEVITADRAGMTLAMTELNALPDAARALLRDQMRSYRRTIEDFVAAGRTTGVFRSDVDPALAAMAVLGAVNWTSRWLRADGRLSPTRVGEQLADLLLGGLAVPGARLGPPIEVEAAEIPSAPSGRERQVWDAAAHLFRTRGVAATSVQDLADAVGLGKSSLYHYIDTKEKLLYDMIRNAEQAAVLALEDLIGHDAPAIDRLYAAIRFDVRHLIDHLDTTSLALHAVRELKPRHRDVVAALVRRYATTFETLIAAGRAEATLRDTPDAVVALRGTIGVMSWPYRWYRPRGAGDAARLADGLADVLLRGLLTP